MNELYHYGVKGMKWGVRRYQYADGSLTPYGRKRKKYNPVKLKMKDIKDNIGYRLTGKQYVDSYLKKGITFNRIQTSNKFENFAFYATYKKQDNDKYMGLFGKNLKSRADRATKELEKKYKNDNTTENLLEYKKAKEYSDNLKVYQLHIKSTKKLKVPSDENASDIVSGLMKRDKKFKSDVEESIKSAKQIMKRPTQQMLFNSALKSINRNNLSSNDKKNIYKALNLSLTNHSNKHETDAQETFYKELKKKGYNALLDYNDKEFSSYHAKRPMIVFDLNSVVLSSISETNPKIVEKMYRKYNSERLRKEVITNSISLVGRYSTTKMSEYNDYLKRKVDSYLS